MTIFNKNCKKIINDLVDNSGFFPVNQVGKWHSGVHIGLADSISCPVTGTILDCNFSDTETSNYFVIDSLIKKGKEEIHYYSIISDITSYKEIKDFFDEKKAQSSGSFMLADVLPYFTDAGLPLGIKAELKVRNYTSPYVKICEEEKILGSHFYLNKNTNFVCNEKCSKKEPFKYKKMEIEADKDNYGLLYEDIICGAYTIRKGAVVKRPDNRTLNVMGSRKIASEYEKTRGYFDLTKNRKKIGSFGNIWFDACESVEFYVKKEVLAEQLVLVNKDQAEKIPLLVNELKTKILNNKNSRFLRTGTESYLEGKKLQEEENDAHRHADKLENELTYLYKLKGYLEKNEKVAIVSEKQLPIDPSRINIMDSYKRIDKNLNVCINYGANNFAIYTADENLIVFDNFLLQQIKDCKNTLSFNEIQDHKEIRVIQKRTFDKNITGLKTIVDGKEQSSYPQAYKGKSVCECRPYLFNDDYTYSFTLNNNQDEAVYLKYQIKDWKSENVNRKKGIYVYGQDNKKYPSEILEDNEEILRIEKIGEDSLNLTLPSGTVCCEAEDASLNIDFLEDTSFIGKPISKETYIGNVNSNHVDWAMFFQENIIDELRKIKKQVLSISKDNECKKKIVREFKLNLPEDTNVQLNGKILTSIKLDLVLKRVQAAKNEIEVKTSECNFTKNLSCLYIRHFGQYVNVKCKTEEPLSFGIQETGSTLDKKFYDYINIVLKKISSGRFGCELQPNNGGFYIVHLELSPEDISEYFNLAPQITIKDDCLQAAKNKKNIDECEITILNDTVINTENCLSLPENYNDYNYDEKNYKTVKLAGANGIPEEYIEISERGDTYYLKREILKNDGAVRDYIKEYCDSLVPLNYGPGKLVDDNICPATGSLICRLPELKDKLRNIDIPAKKIKLGECFDIQESNYLYNPDTDDKKDVEGSKSSSAYRNAVFYTSRLISKHPMEFDRKLFEEYLKYYGLSPEDAEILDIYGRISERLKVGKNSFYFVYAPGFVSMLDEAGLFEFNPYEGLTYSRILNGKFDNVIGVDPNITKVISNPGMTTLYNPYKDKNCKNVEYQGKKYSGVNGFFNAEYSEYHPGYTEYWHEGIDFRGKTGATVVSLINGTVLKCGKREDKDEGFILIQSAKEKKLFYLALHVNHNSLKVKDDDTVFPGMELGETIFMKDSKGNDASHLHVSAIRLPENIEAVSKSGVIDKGINRFPTWGDFKTPNQEIWTNMINPFNYNGNDTWKGRYI